MATTMQLIVSAQALISRRTSLGNSSKYFNPATIFPTTTYADGTGVSQVKEGTEFVLSAIASPKIIDLFGSGAGDYKLTGIDGTIVFTKIKSLLIRNDNLTTGLTLVLGGAAATAWEAPFNAVAGGKIEVGAGGALVLLSPVDGWTVDNTHKLLKVAAASGTLSFTMNICGNI